MFRRRFPGSLFLLPLLIGGCTGCAREEGQVHGQVSFRDQVLTSGSVLFYADDGSSTYARIREDGRYSATLPVGPTRVSVVSHAANPFPQTAKEPKPVPPKIPDKFQKPESSGLSLVVVRGVQEFDIVMESNTPSR